MRFVTCSACENEIDIEDAENCATCDDRFCYDCLIGETCRECSNALGIATEGVDESDIDEDEIDLEESSRRRRLNFSRRNKLLFNHDVDCDECGKTGSYEHEGENLCADHLPEEDTGVEVAGVNDGDDD